nr:unnamed protein product [Callosobruchus analis]
MAKPEVSEGRIAAREETPDLASPKDKFPEPQPQNTEPQAEKDKTSESAPETEAKPEVPAVGIALREKPPKAAAEKDKSPELAPKDSVSQPEKDKTPDSPQETTDKSEMPAAPVAIKEVLPEKAAEKEKSPESPRMDIVPHAEKDKTPVSTPETTAKSETTTERIALKEETFELVALKDKSPEPLPKDTVPQAEKEKTPASPPETVAKSEISMERIAVKQETLELVAPKGKSPEQLPKDTVPQAEKEKAPELPPETMAKLETSAERTVVKEITPKLASPEDKSPKPLPKDTVSQAEKYKTPESPPETMAKSEVSTERIAVKEETLELVAPRDKSLGPLPKDTVPQAEKDKTAKLPPETLAKLEVSTECIAVKEGTLEPVAPKYKSLEPLPQDTVPQAVMEKTPESPPGTMAKSEISTERIAVQGETLELVAPRDESPEPLPKDTVPQTGMRKTPESPPKTIAKSEIPTERIAEQGETFELVAAKVEFPEPLPKDTVPQTGMEKIPESPPETMAKSKTPAERTDIKDKTLDSVSPRNKSPEPLPKDTEPQAGTEKIPVSPPGTMAKSEISTERTAIQGETPELVAPKYESPEPLPKDTVPQTGMRKTPESPPKTIAKSEIPTERIAEQGETFELVAAKVEFPEPLPKDTVPQTGMEKIPESPPETLELVAPRDESPEPLPKDTEPQARTEKIPVSPPGTMAKSEISTERIAVQGETLELVAPRDESPEPLPRDTEPQARTEKIPVSPRGQWLNRRYQRSVLPYKEKHLNF